MFGSVIQQPMYGIYKVYTMGGVGSSQIGILLVSWHVLAVVKSLALINPFIFLLRKSQIRFLLSSESSITYFFLSFFLIYDSFFLLSSSSSSSS